VISFCIEQDSQAYAFSFLVYIYKKKIEDKNQSTAYVEVLLWQEAYLEAILTDYTVSYKGRFNVHWNVEQVTQFSQLFTSIAIIKEVLPLKLSSHLFS